MLVGENRQGTASAVPQEARRNKGFRWMAPIPRIDPAVSFPVSFPFPNLGNVGILTTLMQGSSGIICSDWKTIHTGGSGASVRQLEEMRSRSGLPGK